jgi:hypothetical protein
MKFPITRETLQAFDYVKEQEEMREEEIQKRFAQILEALCKEFKQNMPHNSKEKKFVWRNIHMIRSIHVPNPIFNPTGMAGQGTYSKMDDYLTQFVNKLKEVFIGCDIIIDPLKTYLIIDWS